MPSRLARTFLTFFDPQNTPLIFFKITLDSKAVWHYTLHMIKNIETLKRLTPSQIRKLSKSEIEDIYPFIKSEYKRFESFASLIEDDSKRRDAIDTEFHLLHLRDACYNRLEKYAKEERANAREAKKNAKEVEQKRIEGLAFNLRKLLDPVEKALGESIIENDNRLLKNQDKFFKSLPKPYLIRLLYGCYAKAKKKDEITSSDFRLEYGRFWDTNSIGFGFGNDPKKVSKKKNISKKIESDAKAYAKNTCDSFACKIVVKTEQEIASRKSSEKIVSTNYQGSINPWDGGQVIVKTDKSEYVWNTKVILNFSKYGTPFNQWPTRLQK